MTLDPEEARRLFKIYELGGPTSLLVLQNIARRRGISFNDLLARINAQSEIQAPEEPVAR